MGVRVEFVCEGSGSGYIFSIVIIFSSTIVTGMPLHDFKVFVLVGLNVHG